MPIVRNSFVPEKVKKKIAHKFRSALVATGLYAALDYVANNINRLSSTFSRMQGVFTRFPCVGSLVNENLTMAQKELLFWLGGSVWVCNAFKQMMRNRTFVGPYGSVRYIVLLQIVLVLRHLRYSCF